MPTQAVHVWRPGAARVVVLEAGPCVRGRASADGALPRWPGKDPADVLDYGFDIAPALAGNGGDAIATLDVTIDPVEAGGLQLASAAADGARAVLWLGGGQPGTTYTVTLTLGTQAGRTLARSVLLPVMRLATPATPAGVLLTESGAPLLDSAGDPLTLEG